MMNLTTSLLASIESSFWEDVNFQLIGFCIVLLTLAGIWLALEIIGSFFKAAARRQAAVKAAAAAATPSPTASQSDHELMAVIGAAIDTVIAQPHQVISISPQSTQGGTGQSAWSSEGRKEIYRSHRIR